MIYRLTVLLVVTVLTGCASPKYSVSLSDVMRIELGRDDSDIPNYRCTVGAHRGDSLKYTENTFGAIASAEASDSYAFIEFDVQYSADGKAVVFHDKRLRRVFGSLKKVEDVTFEELLNLSEGEILSYEEAMAAAGRKRVNIEIKSQGDRTADLKLADFIIRDIRRRRIVDRVLISSISGDIIKYVNSVDSDVATGQIFWIKSSTYVHLDVLTDGLYKDVAETQADYVMLHASNLRNMSDLIRLKPGGKTIVFWDFGDRMYIVHKDLSDRLWGRSAVMTVFDQIRYRVGGR